MIAAVMSFVSGLDIAALLAIIGTVVAGLFGFGTIKKREGRKDAEHDAMRDAAKRVDKGRKAVSDGRDGRDPDQRLRDTDSKW